MKFKGRVKTILPKRSGVSQRTGNEWQALPFIFEYFENPTDRFADTVLLETFDTKVIEVLKENMEVICDFGHKIREYEGKIYNEIRLYKIESVQRASRQPADGTTQVGTSNNPTPPQNAATGAENNAGGQDDDDLPF